MKWFKGPPAPLLSASQSTFKPGTVITRNPILQDSETVQKPASLRINDQQFAETSQTRYLAERPRGLARGEFSNALQGSFAIGSDGSSDFIPGRRLVENPNPQKPMKVTRKKLLQEYDSRDPISQADPSYEPDPVRPRSTQDWKPSPLTEFENQRKCLLPSELGLHQRPGFYEKRNKSSVFDEEEDRKMYPKRRIEDPEAEVPGLLQYKYALPYRDQAVSQKPQSLRPPRYY